MKPDGFDFDELYSFLYDEIPRSHADYVKKLVEIGRKHEAD